MKKIFLTLFLFLLFVSIASASLSVGSGTVTYTDNQNRFTCLLNTSTATTLTQVCAAPSAGISYYITDIHFGSSAAGGTAADSYPTLKYGTGTNCGTGTTTFWAVMTLANTTNYIQLMMPIKIPAANAVCFIMSTAGTKVIFLGGFQQG